MSILWTQKLTHETYVIYGARFYNNIYGRWDDYFSDLKMFGRISKVLVSRKNTNNQISIHNILNNYISLGNVFTGNSLARLAFFLTNPVCHDSLKTVLYFIHRLPPSLPEVELSSIPYDTELLQILESL